MAGAVEPSERPATTGLQDFDSVPLFMQSLPEHDDGENVALEALRSLVYEDGPEATALRLKDEANTHFKHKQFRQALGFYSQAINEVGKDLPVDLLRVLHCNRAACQLELQNYGSCIRDCAQVLKLTPADGAAPSVQFESTTKKALFRSAKALFRLDKFDEALDSVSRLAQYKDGLDPASKGLLEEIQKKLRAKEHEIIRREEAVKQAVELEDAVKRTLKSRRVWIPDAWNYREASTLATPPFQPPHFETDADSDLLVPVFVLRPRHNPPTRDLIPEWNENVSIAEQMDAFAQQDPSMSGDLQFYAVTKRGRMLKLGRNLTLAKILQQGWKAETQDGLELVGGWALEVYAVPSAEASTWIQEMKADIKAKVDDVHSLLEGDFEHDYDLTPGFLDRLERERDQQRQPALQASQRHGHLQALSDQLGQALLANGKFQDESAQLLNALNSSADRVGELQIIAKDLLNECQPAADAEVVHPGLQHISLSWFKHYHGKDLPEHPDGQILYNYLSETRQKSWSKDEITTLKREAANELQKAKHYHNSHGMPAPDSWSLREEANRIDWEKIAVAPELRGHTAIECRLRWMSMENPKINHSVWSTAETSKLHDIVAKKNATDWAAIAEELGTGRTPAACLKQYRKKSQEKRDWSKEEDDRLREAISKFGANWQSVARYVGRTSNQCINRWTKTLKPGIKRGRWTPDEDAVLRAAIEACGTVWKKVVLRVRGRTDQQCRERWANVLDPRLQKRKPWTDEEDEKLKECVAKVGPKWAEISKLFDGARTDNAIFRRYEELNKNPAAPKKKRARGAVKGASTTSRNKSLAQIGLKSTGKRAKKEEKTSGEGEEEEAAETEVEEDQLNDDAVPPAPLSAGGTGAGTSAAGPSLESNIDPSLQSVATGLPAAKATKATSEPPAKKRRTTGPERESEPPSLSASSSADEDTAHDRQTRSLKNPQTTRSGRQTRPVVR